MSDPIWIYSKNLKLYLQKINYSFNIKSPQRDLSLFEEQCFEKTLFFFPIGMRGKRRVRFRIRKTQRYRIHETSQKEENILKYCPILEKILTFCLTGSQLNKQ